MKDAEEYKRNLGEKVVTSEQMKLEREMKEVTLKPKINERSKNLKRGLSDLYNWRSRKSKREEIVRDRYEVENSKKLSKIQSTRIINPNSELIAAKFRKNGERIEDKLLRDGIRVQQKHLQLINDHTQEEQRICSPRIQNENKLDYKKILYPSKKPLEDKNFDLEEISHIQSRQYVISRLFRERKKFRYE